MTLADPKPIESLHVERYFLGGLILEPGLLANYLGTLAGRDFAYPFHAATYELLCDMVKRGVPIDVLSITEEIRVRGGHDRFGGLGYVAELPDGCSSTVNLKRYADIVREHSRLRKLREISTTLYNAAHGTGEYSDMPAGDIADEWIPRLLDLSVTRGVKRTTATLSESWAEAENERFDRQAGALPAPMLLGFPELDRLVRCRPGDLVIIGGVASMGKSAFAQALTMEMVRKNGSVLYCSLEMPKPRLARRLAAYQLGIPTARQLLDDDDQSGIEVDDIERFTKRLLAGELRVTLCDRPRMSIAQVAAEARMMWAMGGLKAVVVDHLHLMNHGRLESKNQAIGETTGRAKELAMDLGVPVFLLAQLNRTAARRADPTARRTGGPARPWWETVAVPQLDDLRDSGAIEQDADLVMFPLHASRCGLTESQYVKAGCVVVAKQRDGGVGTVPVEWDGPCAAYRPLVDPLFHGAR